MDNLKIFHSALIQTDVFLKIVFYFLYKIRLSYANSYSENSLWKSGDW